MGKDPMCLRCSVRGHRSKDCIAPYCSKCRVYTHDDDNYPVLMNEKRQYDEMMSEFPANQNIDGDSDSGSFYPSPRAFRENENQRRGTGDNRDFSLLVVWPTRRLVSHTK